MLFFHSQNKTNQQQVEITNGLKAHWLLNGNAEDSSGNGWNGVIYGAISSTGRFDEPNGSMEFESGDRIVIPNSSTFVNQVEISVSLWIYSTNIVSSNFQTIFGKHTNGRHIVITLGSVENRPGFHCYGNGYDGVGSDESVPLNTWTHITSIISSSNEALIYVNGELKGQKTMSQTPRFVSPNLIIGNFSSLASSSYDFDGKIADVRVFDRVLTESEITLLSQ